MNLELAHILKMSKFIHIYHVEIQKGLLRVNLHHEIRVHVELTDDSGVYQQPAGVMHRNEESVICRFDDLEVSSGGLARTDNVLACIVL